MSARRNRTRLFAHMFVICDFLRDLAYLFTQLASLLTIFRCQSVGSFNRGCGIGERVCVLARPMMPFPKYTDSSSLQSQWGWWRRCSHQALSVIDVVYSSGWASPSAIIPSALRRGCVCGAVAADWGLVRELDWTLTWRTSILLILGRLWQLQKTWNVVRRLFLNGCKAVCDFYAVSLVSQLTPFSLLYAACMFICLCVLDLFGYCWRLLWLSRKRK